MDRDIGTRDDPLGNVSMELSEICNNGFDDVWLPLEDVQHGMLHVQLTWLWLANDPLELDRAIKLNSDVDGAHNAILMVFLDGAGNLPVSIW
ncbi:unnamed protein product [Lymnaea stagnalis]|uniref:Uncharacterized protein n=1 Tax=Lymnaea stagnalis TaxID=6523 RepID=A0AAV2IMU3_LYMST